MNEITRVHLGRQPFTIAVDAHKLLKAYLAAIEKHVGKNAPEVIEEVELRIAELLIERGITGEQAVLVSDIEHVKEQLGKPADFSDDEEVTDEGSETVADTPRRLFRDTENGKLGGVASGLAAYLNLDVTLVRIAFIVLTIAWGGGLVLYLIMWLVVPEAKTGSDYLQLKGKPITVDTIKEFVDQADVPRRAEQARTVGSEMISKCVRIVGWLIGLGLAGFAAIISLWTIAFGVYAWIAPERLSDAGEIFPKTGQDHLFMVAVMTAVLAACTALFLVGIALMRRKRVVPGWAMAGIIAVAFAGTAVSLPLGFKVIPDAADRYDAAAWIKPRDLTQFTSLQVSGENTRVEFVPSSSYKMEIKARGHIKEQEITSEVRDGVLYVETGDVRKGSVCDLFCAGEYVELIVYAPTLLYTDIRNEALLQVNQPLQQDAIELRTDDTATIELRHAQIREAKLTNRSGSRLLILSGFNRNASRDDVLTVYGDAIFLPRADDVDFISDNTCEQYESELTMDRMPARLVLNGQSVVSETQLQGLQSDEQATIFNCIAISPHTNYSAY